ncbi:class I adenylate-forming enzyme family protein [Halioxenophilus sp. WMMB6]|uniref:class I adenylate-forming enzyme family protein n=1 Tax=Halioxenophilus sp. WMMB6 TaxID=3073815 RepID=UPI00295EF85A|nr:class I adenylate-forming enzyme family protein [Halioxenophilus sp. WMMB6]
MATTTSATDNLSLVHAMPLAEEPGMGALTIPGYLLEITERFRNNEAVVMHKGDSVERWSYQDLYDHSLAVAKALIACGVGKDTRVGMLMTNRSEFLSVMFGTALAGGVFVPLSTFSTPEEMEHLLSVSGVSILIFEDRVLKKDFTSIIANIEPAIKSASAGAIESAKFPFLTRLVSMAGVTAVAPHELDPATVPAIEDWQAFLACGSDVPTEVVEARAKLVGPADTGGLFFSSGTTSLPKGILHRQRAFAIQFWRWPRLWGLTGLPRCWTGNGFFWSGPVTILVGTAFSTGGALIMQPLFDSAEALRLIKEERVTLMNGRPHQWARMQSEPSWAEADFSSLQQITKGEIILEHPTTNTSWDMPNAFGTTETMAILSSFVAGDPANSNRANFGKTLPGNTIKVIDPQTGELVAMGERGEVCIKGPTLMQGYLGKTPEQCFDEDGFYRTGDGGYIDAEGHLFWEGRLNDIIKTGGANVSPQEVDTAVAKINGVKRTQTVGVPHDTLSEMVVACIVPIDGVTLSEDEVIGYLKERLASYKVPRKVLFFTEEEYPLTGNEKVKAGDVRKLACERLGVGEKVSV